MKIRPLGNKLVVRMQEPKKMTDGGLHLPESASRRTRTGEVVAAGPGLLLDSGALAPMSCEVGDVVVLAENAGTEVEIGGEKFLVVSDDLAIAAVEG
jgi:chaperonin GroES